MHFACMLVLLSLMPLLLWIFIVPKRKNVYFFSWLFPFKMFHSIHYRLGSCKFNNRPNTKKPTNFLSRSLLEELVDSLFFLLFCQKRSWEKKLANKPTIENAKKREKKGGKQRVKTSVKKEGWAAITLQILYQTISDKTWLYI